MLFSFQNYGQFFLAILLILIPNLIVMIREYDSHDFDNFKFIKMCYNLMMHHVNLKRIGILQWLGLVF